MSQSAVLNYIEAQVETIASTPSGTLRCIQGIPNEGLPADIGQYPLVVLSTRDLEPVQLTAGAGGIVHERYAVIISLYLGPVDMAHDIAMARAKLFPSRLRAKFASNWILGGNCWHAELRGPANNIEIDAATGMPTYRVLGVHPKQQWALMVTEQTTANAAAL